MKVRKKRKKDTNSKDYKNNLKKSILIFIMLLCIIVAMITYWIYAYHHKHGSFYFDDIRLISYKISDYVEMKGDLVYLKNIDDNINNYFVKEQQNIIENNNVVSVDTKKGLYGGILSIMINYTLQNTSGNYEKIITLNIDLRNNNILNNESLLEKVNVSYKSIATNIFNEYIKLPTDSNKKVIDRISDEELTADEFNADSEKYIIRIREKLPEIIKLYIEDNKVYYVAELSEINEVCYYTNNVKLVNIKREIGKI